MSDEQPSALELRASDAERERAAQLLREAMASGRLNVEELEDRTRLVYEARTRTELERLIGDVLVPANDEHPVAASGSDAVPGFTRTSVSREAKGTHRVLSILGGSKRTGRWSLAASCSVINVLGGSELDLSEVELADSRIELKVISVLGGADITLPEGLNVELSEVAILGGNEVNIGSEQPDPGGPVVHLRLVSVLGGCEVRRGRKLTRKQRKELEAQ